MRRRFVVYVMVCAIGLCAAQCLLMTCSGQGSPEKRVPSAEELENLAQEIAKNLSEGRRRLALGKLKEIEDKFGDKTKKDLWELVVGKLTKAIKSAVWESPLAGNAEDLWGSKLDLSKLDKGLVLLHPFSPSNCGYCFADGEFVRVNYYENTIRQGGRFFGMCLFNPQLDIYSFQKHYKEDYPVLTAPFFLHNYHRDGFPYMIAFKDGEGIWSYVLSPYEETFRTLRKKLWGDKDISLRPTSPEHMAARFIWENGAHLALLVIPDGDEKEFRRFREEERRSTSYTTRYEGQLTDEDTRKNLFFRGISERYSFAPLQGKELPIQLSAEKIKIGVHEFPVSRVGVSAVFPNPHNEERYCVVGVRGSEVKTGLRHNWVDYTIYEEGPDGKPNILLEGFFKKDGSKWEFSPSLAHGSVLEKRQREGGISLGRLLRRKVVRPKRRKTPEAVLEHSARGELWTLGKSNCRFPWIVVRRDGIPWVAWEEQGDILLAWLNKEHTWETIYVENSGSDSFNPVLAYDKEHLWIFYLNNQDGFYRLSGKTFDGQRLSGETLISTKEVIDAITPSVAFNGRKIVLAWSEWKANQKFLRYRAIEDKVLGELRTAQIKYAKGDDYTCAWWPSLTLDEQGNVWGAWNQHYPAILGVYAGNLTQEAMTVSDRGGYPSVIMDKKGQLWAFWESWMWDLYSKEGPQEIRASYYDSSQKQWSVPCTISHDLCIFNQTPKAAVDAKGKVWVCWSGRKSDTVPWNIYLSCFDSKKWSPPTRVSTEGENARAPAISIGKNDEIWLSWHSGMGAGMKIKALHLQKNAETLP